MTVVKIDLICCGITYQFKTDKFRIIFLHYLIRDRSADEAKDLISVFSYSCPSELGAVLRLVGQCVRRHDDHK